MIATVSLVNIHHHTWLQKKNVFSCDEDFLDPLSATFKYA